MEQYWILVEGQRWKRIPWFKTKAVFVKQCEFNEVKTFIDKLRIDYVDNPYNYIFKVGINRGQKLIIIH